MAEEALIHVGDTLWVRPAQVDGIKVEWSDVAIGQGFVFVLVAGEWIRATNVSENQRDVRTRYDRLVDALQ